MRYGRGNCGTVIRGFAVADALGVSIAFGVVVFVGVAAGFDTGVLDGVAVAVGVAVTPSATPTRGLSGAPPPDQRTVAECSLPFTAKWTVAPSVGWQMASAGMLIFQLPAALTVAWPHSTWSIDAITTSPECSPIPYAVYGGTWACARPVPPSRSRAVANVAMTGVMAG